MLRCPHMPRALRAPHLAPYNRPSVIREVEGTPIGRRLPNAEHLRSPATVGPATDGQWQLKRPRPAVLRRIGARRDSNCPQGRVDGVRRERPGPRVGVSTTRLGHARLFTVSECCWSRSNQLRPTSGPVATNLQLEGSEIFPNEDITFEIGNQLPPVFRCEVPWHQVGERQSLDARLLGDQANLFD